MNLKEAVEIMQAHNEWRRGAETEMVDAKDLGRAIDVLISHAMKSQPTTSVSAEEFLKTRKEFYASDGKFEATDEFGEGLVAAAMHDFASRKPAGMRWVKASDRLPILPDPLPKDTIDERGILFVNRVHSAGAFWYPSYGVSAISFLNNYNGWNINDWEWLDEPEYSLDNGLGTTTVYGGKPAGEGYVCQCCNKEYNYDLIVSDDVWKRIAPKSIDGYKGGGLLCPECIVAKILSTPLPLDRDKARMRDAG